MKNKKSFKVSGMSCGHCKSRVEDKLKRIDGITDVTVDLGSGIVTIEGEAADEILKNAIEEIGYHYEGL